MGTDSLQTFLKKVQEDPGLQEELRAKFGDLSAGIPANELATFAAGKGYAFSVKELQGELSDEQLAGVSGGAYEFYDKDINLLSVKLHIPKLALNYDEILKRG